MVVGRGRGALQGWSDNELFTMQPQQYTYNNDHPLNITLNGQTQCWTFVISSAHIETIRAIKDKWEWIGSDWMGISGWYEVSSMEYGGPNLIMVYRLKR